VGWWNQLRLVRGVEDFCSRRFINQLGVSWVPWWRSSRLTAFCSGRLRRSRFYAHVSAGLWRIIIWKYINGCKSGS
jgi:hypothetical protein